VAIGSGFPLGPSGPSIRWDSFRWALAGGRLDQGASFLPADDRGRRGGAGIAAVFNWPRSPPFSIKRSEELLAKEPPGGDAAVRSPPSGPTPVGRTAGPGGLGPTASG